MEIWEGQIMKCNKEGCDGNLNPLAGRVIIIISVISVGK